MLELPRMRELGLSAVKARFRVVTILERQELVCSWIAFRRRHPASNAWFHNLGTHK